MSHYNARPPENLFSLLDQIRAIPAGGAFRARVVVNRAEDKSLELPDRHADVEVLYRENTGYNIGSWDYGWRQPPRADAYLFLQDECIIRKPGWLAAFARAAARPGVGLVGEDRTLTGVTWDEYDSLDDEPVIDNPDGVGPKLYWGAFHRNFLIERGIDPGATPTYLRSLVLYARREVLEAIDGFPIGLRYDEAVGCELGISKRVEAIGLKTVPVGFRPFEYILHPQWKQLRDDSAGLLWAVKKVTEPLAIRKTFSKLKRLVRRQAHRPAGRPA